MLSGNSNEVKGDVKKAIDDGIDILAPSCGIAPNTPLDNIKAAIDERNEYFNL